MLRTNFVRRSIGEGAETMVTGWQNSGQGAFWDVCSRHYVVWFAMYRNGALRRMPGCSTLVPGVLTGGFAMALANHLEGFQLDDRGRSPIILRRGDPRHDDVRRNFEYAESQYQLIHRTK